MKAKRSAILLGLAVCSALLGVTLVAHDIRAQDSDPIVVPSGDGDALIQAIEEANQTSRPIHLAPDSDFILTEINNGENGLPQITGNVRIVGLETVNSIRRANHESTPAFRLFDVAPEGSLELVNVLLTNGEASEGGLILNGGSLSLFHVALADGTAGGHGGGIYNSDPGAEATITLSMIDSSTANRGGAIANSGSLIIEDGSFSNNAADDQGGALYSTGADAAVTITDSDLGRNEAGTGGGAIYNTDSSRATLIRTVVRQNDAGTFGGGIHNTASMDISRSTISENSAGTDGGGIFNGLGVLALNNSTVSWNEADGDGGGIRSSHALSIGDLDIFNSTIAFNSADRGGGLFLGVGTFRIMNTLLAQNQADTGPDVYEPGSTFLSEHNLITDGSDQQSAEHGVDGNLVGTAENPIEPLILAVFVPDHPNDPMPLLPGSPAIGAASAAVCLSEEVNNVDQRGEPRHADIRGECDIGAWDTVTPPDPPVVTVPEPITAEAEGPDGAVVTFETTAQNIFGQPVDVTCEPQSGSSFPLEVTSVNCSAEDAAGETIETFTITVQDTTPPVISDMPADIKVEATGPVGEVVTFDLPTATDLVDPEPDVRCEPESGSTFTLGTTEVVCTAEDFSENTATESFFVTVEDTTPPVLSDVPADITAEATGPDGASVNFDLPAATDLVDADPSVDCEPGPGSIFPLGTTEVVCTAEDFSENTATEGFFVTVEDTTPPVLSDVPADITAEATGPDGASVNFDLPTATDLVDPEPDVRCEPESGSNFPLGTTEVVCTAEDCSENTATESFFVTVEDTTPPDLFLPDDVTVPATGPDGAIVEFDVSAVDLVDGDVQVQCSHQSGDTFPTGTTMVECQASDGTGNNALGSFPIRVLSAEEQLRLLIEAVESSDLPLRTKSAYLRQLSSAQTLLNLGANARACQQIGAFAVSIDALNQRTGEDPELIQLRDDALRIADALGCTLRLDPR